MYGKSYGTKKKPMKTKKIGMKKKPKKTKRRTV